MKIECVKDRFTEAVIKAERVIGKNLSLPVLSCILIEAQGSTAVIRSTNLDLGIEITVPVKVKEQGSVAVPGQVFSSFLSALQSDHSMVCEQEGSVFTITTEKNTTTINTMATDDFPTIPLVGKQNRFLVPVKELLDGFHSVLFSSSIASVKPEYASILLYSDAEGIVFVATDSFRLAEKKIRLKKKVEIQHLLIPTKNATEITRIFSDMVGDVAIDVEGNQISFSLDSVYVTSRLVDGSFPDYKQIIPKEFTTEAVVLKQDFMNAMKVANIFSDTFMQVGLQVIPKNKIFELKTKNNTVGEQKTTIPAVFSGDEVAMNFNHRYLIDCFSSLNADSASFLFTGQGRPLVVRGATNKNFTYLIMPMNR